MRFLSIPLLATVLTAACTDRTATGPSLEPAVAGARVTTPGEGPWSRIVEGETGPGSLYALYIPQNWNGEAVYYAHGFRPPVPYSPIALEDQDNFFAVRDALGQLGYAFAYSSYSENGLAEKDGAQRTKQLRGLLTSELSAKPQRNYLVGYSLGALIAMDIAEHNPTQYDGVLAMCGAVGGSQLELQYVGDVRALFDYYYPDVLPGNVIDVPAPPMSVADLQARVINAITPTAANPRATLGLYAIASTAQTPLAYAPVGSLGDPSSVAFQSLVGSLITALYYQLIGTPDVVDRTHGHSPYGNRGITYTMGTPAVPAAALTPLIASMINGSNAGVARYDSPVDAQNYLQHNYTPTGNVSIPVVSVHNLWDPLVPFFHEPALGAAAITAGTTGNVLQRAIPNYGHCNFGTPLVISSFQTLVNWVRSGDKPAS